MSKHKEGFFGKVVTDFLASRKQLIKIGLFLFVLILVALALSPEGEDLDYQFIEEDGFATVVSSFLLATASAFAFVSFFLSKLESSSSRWTWGILSIGFAFLSIDEVFQIHEQIGWILEDHLDSGPFRNWNDIIVIGYGVLAIPIVWKSLPVLRHHHRLIVLFTLGFLAYAAHTITDSMVEHATTTSIIIEESFKLASVTFLASGVFSAVHQRLRSKWE